MLQLLFRLDAEQETVDSTERIGIGTADLVELATVADTTATRVAERAAWEFAGGLGLSAEELGEAMESSRPGRLRSQDYFYRSPASFSPGQITHLEDGSIVLTVVLMGHLVIPWAMKNLFGEAVVEGWKESVGREKLKLATREIFGGASDAALKAAEQAPTRLRLESFNMEPATGTGTSGTIVFGFRKAKSLELEAKRDWESMVGTSPEETVDDSWTLVEEEPAAEQASEGESRVEEAESKEEREMGA